MLQKYCDVNRLKGHCSSSPSLSTCFTSVASLGSPIQISSTHCPWFPLPVLRASLNQEIIRKYTVRNRGICYQKIGKRMECAAFFGATKCINRKRSAGRPELLLMPSEVHVLMPHPSHSYRGTCCPASGHRTLKHQIPHYHPPAGLDRR